VRTTRRSSGGVSIGSIRAADGRRQARIAWPVPLCHARHALPTAGPRFLRC